MAKDIIITPLDGDIVFDNSSGTECGSITQDGDNLVISNAVGDVLLGDGASDIYIGDGTNNVDILFEQSGAIKAEDGSTSVTLTIGSGDTTLVLESPTLNTPALAGASTINNTLTLTTTNGKIIFDYEAAQTGEYTTEVPLLQIDRSGTPITILSRASSGGAIVLGADDMVHIAAGDTKTVVKDNLNMSEEQVVFSSEAGFTAYGFPSNDTSWANRNEFRFRSDSGTSSENGLYIGDGGNTQFIDVSRNLSVVNADISGNITTSGNISASGTGSFGMVGIGTTTPTAKLQVGTTADTSDNAIRVLSGDGNKAGFEAYGNSQGTGYLYVGQDASYGGGIMYDGDTNPDYLGGETDQITFFRRSSGTDTSVFSYIHNSNTVYFYGGVRVTSAITASSNISASGNLQGVNFHAFNNITRVGVSAGSGNTGNYQTAVGNGAGDSNSGDYQTAIGVSAGDSNSGQLQTAIGQEAGYNNSGSNQIAIGYGAGYNNTGNNQVAIGYNAGFENALHNQFIVKHLGASATPLIQGNFQSGSIGIGLALPQANLHVAGNILATTNITASGNISASGTGSFGMVGIGKTNPAYSLDCLGNFNINGTNQVNLRCNNANVFNGYTTQTMINSYGLDRPIVFTLNQGITEAMRIAGTTGNVGIGTTNPTAKLHVVGDALITGKITAQEFHTEFVSASIIYQSGSTKFGDTSDDVHSFSGSLRVTGSGDHYFTDGNVGIGTSTPTEPLHLIGNSLIDNGLAGSLGSSQFEPSPTINFIGQHWNSTTGEKEMSGGMLITSDTNNVNPPISKLSFLVGGDGNMPTEQMYVTSLGQFNILGGGDFAGTSLADTNSLTIRNTAAATSGTPQDSNKLVLEGRAWNSAQGSIANKGYIQMLNTVNNVNPIVERMGFFTQAGTNGGAFTERLSIDNNGNVGIGTASPTAKLHVSGNIIASVCWSHHSISKHKRKWKYIFR
jgi:hypothetical protein